MKTPRLVLRDLTRGDAAFILALVNEPPFIRYIGDRGIRTLEAAAHYIEHGPWTRPTERGMGFRLVARLDTGEAIGICGLLKRDSLDAPDVGFAFLTRHWSQGYAFEAGTAMLDHARNTLGHARVLAIVSPDNAASIRLIEKLGLRRERLARLTADAGEVAIYATASDTIPPPP